MTNFNTALKNPFDTNEVHETLLKQKKRINVYIPEVEIFIDVHVEKRIEVNKVLVTVRL